MSGFAILDSVEQGLAPTTVGVQEFAESSSFCGKPLYPRQIALLKLIFLEEMTGAEEDILTYWTQGGRNSNETSLSPSIRERRDFLRENGYKHFREVQLIGGRRSSKGFMTGLAMAYVMYNTLMLGDPGGYYGIDKEKDIYFSCVAGSEQQAKEFQYADLVSTVETCKAFEPYLVKSLETEFRVATNTDLRKASAAKARGSKIQRDIAKLRGKALAANAGTLRGSATMVIALDEMAHMIPGESKASADQVYTAAEPSLDQFGLDGMMFLNSSPYTKVGMFYECYEANMRQFDPLAPVTFTNPLDMDSDDIAVANGNPRNFCFQFPSWALFEGYRYYASRYRKKERGKEFGKMITVSPDWDPDTEDDQDRPLFGVEDKAAIVQARAKESANPETYKVERRGKFAEVTDAYLNPSMVDQMYKGIPDGYEAMPNGDLVRRYLPIPTNHGQGALPASYRYKFHVDPSSTTAGFGFAIAHIEYFPDATTGLDQEHVVFDLIKRWDPASAQGKVIRWGPIINEIVTYAMIFRPYEITFDQHQSADPIQQIQEQLNARNNPCRVFEKFATNELNWKRWEVTKTAIYQGLVHAPYDEYPNPSPMGSGTFTSKDELKFLQQIATGGKFPRIEKQDIGPVQTKDMADCYDDQTEVLTQEGWKLFKEVREGLPVATRNPQGELQYQIPTHHIERDAKELLVYETKRLNFAVTPGHRMLVTKDRGQIESFIRAEDLSAKIYRVPKTATLLDDSASDVVSLAEVKLVGFWLADGRKCKDYDTYQGIRVSQSKAEGIAWVDTVVEELGLPFRRFVYETGEVVWHINSRLLRSLCQSLQEQDELRLPALAFTSTRIGQALLEGLLVGDGVWSNREQRYAGLWNTSEYLIDDVQRLLVHLGRSGRKVLKRSKGVIVNQINGKNVVATKDLWYLHIDLKSNARLFTDRLRRVPYDGQVYCLTVPNGTLLVRRHGVIMWCGNCIAECVYSLVGNLFLTHMRDRLASSSVAGGAPGGYGIGQGGPVGGAGPAGISDYYSRREEKVAQTLGTRSSLTRGALGFSRRNKAYRSRGRW